MIDLDVTQRTMTVSELIDALAQFSDDVEVRFPLGFSGPNGRIHSYRGFYEDVALGWTADDGHEEFTVGELTALLEGAIGDTFEGYKGGDYRCTRDTLCWVDNVGDWSSIGIIGVQEGSHGQCVLLTASCEKY